jgi:hypothetical protein
MDFESRVRDCDGGDSKTVRGLHPGYRQDNSKKEGRGSKVLIFHYVPLTQTSEGKRVKNKIEDERQ